MSRRPIGVSENRPVSYHTMLLRERSVRVADKEGQAVDYLFRGSGIFI